TSVPSLDFFVTFLIKQKSKSPSAASRGKPGQRPMINKPQQDRLLHALAQPPLQFARTIY
ncbi:hypothetical protein, partial [Pedobacter petrophilus]|uniref:hypothetical protein n=1 Tax=Pedobacter petrophilus TaxID=1908241 RepID=UPI001AE04389